MTNLFAAEIQGLTLGYRMPNGVVRHVVVDFSLELAPGSVTGLVGESGCGKSTLGLGAVGWLGPTGVRLAGDVRVGERHLYQRSVEERRRLWGRELAYLPQDAGSALHPTRRIGSQFDELLRLHTTLGRAERTRTSEDMLAAVRFQDPAAAVQRYPFQFSGGQRQRIALALSLILEPRVLVLDEPTAGADATIQIGIIDLLRKLLTEREVAVLYISHDIALLARLAHTLVVMYAGEIVEKGPTRGVLERPRHPYTAALVAAAPRRSGGSVETIPGLPPLRSAVIGCAFAPRCNLVGEECRHNAIPLRQLPDGRVLRCIRSAGVATPRTRPQAPQHLSLQSSTTQPRLAVRSLVCEYRDSVKRRFRAVNNVTIVVHPGEIVGLVGESGSGKSTILRAVAGLLAPASGTITLDERQLAGRARHRSDEELRAIQMVFQNPDGSLNPRHTVERIVGTAIRRFQPDLQRANRRLEVNRLLGLVQLDARLASRFPHQLSGGQKQRVALARALAAAPTVLLCDEVISALDVSVQAGVLNLLDEIRRTTHSSIVFVSHDLAAVRIVSDRIYVMFDGAIREVGSADDILDRPVDEYTRALVSATSILA